MASETGGVSLGLPDIFYRRLFSLIPIESSDSILGELAAVWCEATAAKATYLILFDQSSLELTAGVFRRSQTESDCFTQSSIRIDQNRSLLAQSHLIAEQGRPFHLISSSPVQFFPIPCGQISLAGVFLFSAHSQNDTLSLISELTEISRRLFTQVLKTGKPQDSQYNNCQSCHSVAEDGNPEKQRVLPDLDKLEAMAEFAAGAGHEINNPVATIAGRVQMLLKHETDPERRQSLATIGGQAYRIRDMIGDAMLFGRPPAPRPTAVNLSKAIDEVQQSLSEAIHTSEVLLTVDLPATACLWADETQLKVVISNLISNCLNVLEAGGQICISAEEETVDAVPMLHLRIKDNGPGLSEQEQKHLFDPFYSARQAGRGLGFGLSKCWRIVDLHGGQIEAEISQGHGVTLHLLWPLNERQK
ncbi:sensor histidine kinase [Gimesia algae]|uniref:histidine kinase n=1 Tax=Gimesia algae TaxID=2527971 RepID=A0A517VC83_9PLAN|nr:ATP-binding protein [Gimesia algae]QDT90611.1 Sporulation kinase E [Gimesia algae]